MMSQGVESDSLLVANFAAVVFHRYLEVSAFSFKMCILDVTIKLPFSFEGAFTFVTLVALGFINLGNGETTRMR
jgi:hypothetical protein